MERRYIGIHIDGDTLRVAVMEANRDVPSSLETRTFSTPEEMTEGLQEILRDTRIFGDRLAAAFPSMETFVRWLKLPFADAKKIESVLPFELSSQLPVPMEEYTTDFQSPVPTGETYRTAAAAVRTQTLEDFIATFDRADIPLHIVDLAPFAYVRGLKDHLADSLLVYLGAQETSISLMTGGRVQDYRVLPSLAPLAEEEAARRLIRESGALQRESGRRDLPMAVIGPEATPELMDALRKEKPEVEVPHFLMDGEPVGPEYLPAIALALRAAIPAKQREFNFRRGKYALKNEWPALKREMIAAGMILFLTALIVAGSSYLSYVSKARRAEELNQLVTSAFRETFPGTAPMVDVPRQMRQRINELRQQATLIGTGPQGSPLTVLQEISRLTPTEVKIDIRDLSYSSDTVRLEGVTSSFDAINQIAQSLEQSTLFSQVQIADAKVSLDGSQVDFRLTLSFSKQG